VKGFSTSRLLRAPYCRLAASFYGPVSRHAVNTGQVWSPRDLSHPRETVPPALAREELIAGRLRISKVLPYQRARTPFLSNVSLALSSGLLLVFAFPDWNLWSLAWVGTAPLIMAVVREQRFWRSLLLGTLTGTVFFVGTSHWVTYSMHTYGGIPLWLCFIIIVLLAGVLALFTGLFAGTISWATARLGGWAMLAAPLAWTASEWLRLQVTGMGWNALGYSQAFQPAIIQISRFGGVYAVSALLVSASSALVFALVYLEKRRGVIVLTVVGVQALAAVVYGQSLRPAASEAGAVWAAVVQPDLPIAGDWDDPGYVDSMIERHTALATQLLHPDATRSASSEPKATLVIWPESPMPMEYDRNPDLRARLADFARSNDVYLLFNSWGYPAESGITNSAIVIGPSGDKIAEYDKIALLPYGEYVPGSRWVPFMDRVHAIVADLTPGTALTLSDVAGARLGAFICFEASRPEIARRMRLGGASELVQISNEAWFGPTAAARQMLAHAIFRAVENNADLIRATNSGQSAWISRYGEVDGLTPMFEEAVRLWPMKTVAEASRDDLTFYTRHGDLFAIACVAGSLIVAGAGLVPLKRKEND
jgi:apolipoprotein N-acyltransferase